ncbi:MAG: NAD(P)H-dependent glycerol-3-phosphate dehydrogenase, partial [Acutalibacteraceae bacterium]|nr:NAD(P)H-dependent glycerol-3-phosphate dehydrogenase [Acutalibacteraceae bacterium]
RNHRYGELLGKGTDTKEALEKVGTVEGYFAAAAAIELSKKYNVELPICEQCYEIMYNGADCKKALDILKKNMDKLNEVARVLFHEEKISGEDFRAIMEGKKDQLPE